MNNLQILINVSSARLAFPWFAGYANLIVEKVIPPHLLINKERNSSIILDITFGMIFFFIIKVLMVLSDAMHLSLSSKTL
jgi:hypothetical protein